MGRRIEATPTTVFAPLVDPSNHSAIDGTGWVRGPLKEGIRLTAKRQVFDMAMFHPQHPDGGYEIAKGVVAFELPTAIDGAELVGRGCSDVGEGGERARRRVR